MKTKLFFSTIFAIIGFNANAQTNVGGTISSNATWTLSNSPYIVTGSILINSGVTLIIKPGVIVKFNDTTGMDVSGTLIAKGTNDSLITFTTSQYLPYSGTWYGITFDASSSRYNFTNQTGCIMEYCRVKCAGEINEYSGFSQPAIDIYFASPFIDNCIIDNNEGGALNIRTNDSISITNNIISNNSSFSHVEYIISFSGKYAVFANNIFYKNDGNPAFLFGDTCLVRNNIFVGNTNSGADLIDLSPDAKFTHNTVIDNPLACGDVISAEDTFKYNTITRNILNGCDGIILNTSYNSQYNYNNIYGDFLYSNVSVQHEFRNWAQETALFPHIDAKSNWWGTASSLKIDSLIYDWHDDTTKCRVDYIPFLSSPDTTAPVTPPTKVIKTSLGGGSIKLTWNPNPDMDLSGYKIYWGGFTGYSFSHYINVGNVTSYILSGSAISDTIGVTAYDIGMTNYQDQFKGRESWFTYADTLSPNSIKENSPAACFVKIYPNPATDNFTIESPPDAVIEITNIQGQLIKTLTANDNKTNIDVSALACGVYVVEVRMEEGVEVRKFIKE